MRSVDQGDPPPGHRAARVGLERLAEFLHGCLMAESVSQRQAAVKRPLRRRRGGSNLVMMTSQIGSGRRAGGGLGRPTGKQAEDNEDKNRFNHVDALWYL